MKDTIYDPNLRVVIRVDGNFAHWASPGGQVERYSYPYPTMSGMEGVIRSIYWKPQIEWVIQEIKVLNPVKRFNYKTNEIKNAPSSVTRKMTGIDAQKGRTQRHNSVLQDVSYVVVVSPYLVEECEHGIIKHVEMLRRRVSKGQCYRTPYLGKREFKADFSLATGTEVPIDTTEVLNYWHIGFDDSKAERESKFANLLMEKGRIQFDFEHFQMVSRYH